MPRFAYISGLKRVKNGHFSAFSAYELSFFLLNLPLSLTRFCEGIWVQFLDFISYSSQRIISKLEWRDRTFYLELGSWKLEMGHPQKLFFLNQLSTAVLLIEADRPGLIFGMWWPRHSCVYDND